MIFALIAVGLAAGPQRLHPLPGLDLRRPGGHVTQIANALIALGVRRADAVTLAAPNTSMLYATTLAAQAAGIAAPVNAALSDEHRLG